MATLSRGSASCTSRRRRRPARDGPGHNKMAPPEAPAVLVASASRPNPCLQRRTGQRGPMRYLGVQDAGRPRTQDHANARVVSNRSLACCRAARNWRRPRLAGSRRRESNTGQYQEQQEVTHERFRWRCTGWARLRLPGQVFLPGTTHFDVGRTSVAQRNRHGGSGGSGGEYIVDDGDPQVVIAPVCCKGPAD